MTPIEVVYENGVFRPLGPIELPEGSTGQVLIAPIPSQHSQLGEVDPVDGTEAPGERAYRLLMQIAASPHTPPDEQIDVGERHADILYPKRGKMP